MANMGYENTYTDLKKCYEDLENYETIEQAVEDTSGKLEKTNLKNLVILCRTITEHFEPIE